MPMDFHDLPKLRDSMSYLFVEHSVVERGDSAIKLLNRDGCIQVPVAGLCVLMLGPGTSVTHAAVKILSENGCSILWTGEDGIRLYAQGVGETRKAYHLLRQAGLVSNPDQRMQVALRMYHYRFSDQLDPGLSLPQIRGLEGVRVRTAYQQASELYGVPWHGRNYDFQNWGKADPVNRALSAANALLNGICHAAIVSGGYSPALGFIHTGRQLSFVYDIADLYKTEITIPAAFQIVAESLDHIDSRVRAACRVRFKECRLLERILDDIDCLLEIHGEPATEEWIDSSQENPFPLWEPLQVEGVNPVSEAEP